jgi:chromosomal replication initiator protein
MYIASRRKSNVRELEGALIRLVAYSSLTGRSLTIDLAHEVLRNVIDQGDRAITIDGIQKFVADYYQLKINDLKARSNSKSIAMPRQVAMYLCKTLTHASLPEIGRSFGGTALWRAWNRGATRSASSTLMSWGSSSLMRAISVSGGKAEGRSTWTT